MDLERAREIVGALAEGFDPLTGRPLPLDSVYNQGDVVRALYAVLGVLPEKKEKKSKKVSFFLEEEAKAQYVCTPSPISASEVIRRINRLADLERCHKLPYKAVVEWLLEIGALEEQEGKKCPTDQGKVLGITVEKRNGPRGPYEVIVYDRIAQQFLLDHLEPIMESRDAARASVPPKSLGAQTGKPWSAEQEMELARLFEEGKSVPEIAAAMGRNAGGIRARMKRMGLFE